MSSEVETPGMVFPCPSTSLGMYGGGVRGTAFFGFSPAERAAAAAREAVGARFRFQGRDPLFGVDCVGLAGLAMRAAGCEAAIPDSYALRGDDPCGRIDATGLTRVAAPLPGDLLLFLAGPGQFHLAVMVPGGIVHADAMLRRVVERPGAAPWPLVAAWRCA